jgi:hypothetical protein
MFQSGNSKALQLQPDFTEAQPSSQNKHNINRPGHRGVHCQSGRKYKSNGYSKKKHSPSGEFALPRELTCSLLLMITYFLPSAADQRSILKYIHPVNFDDLQSLMIHYAAAVPAIFIVHKTPFPRSQCLFLNTLQIIFYTSLRKTCPLK